MSRIISSARSGDRRVWRPGGVLVALVRDKLPAIENNDPRVLPELDHHFYRMNFCRGLRSRDVDNDMVPALGAYLGELLVETLGGTWVPRKAIDESQVVIGGVAYLPFLRARHALASQQAQIDSSMTQFYRVAARSRSR